MRQKVKAVEVLDGVINFLFWIAAVLITGMMLIISTGVITRYFFHYSIKWMVEIPEYMLYGIIFLAFAWVQKKNSHIKVDIVVGNLTRRNQVLLEFITSSLGLIICMVLVYFGIVHVLSNIQSHAVFDYAIRLPKAPILAIMPLSFLVAFFQFLKQVMEKWIEWRKKDSVNE